MVVSWEWSFLGIQPLTRGICSLLGCGQLFCCTSVGEWIKILGGLFDACEDPKCMFFLEGMLPKLRGFPQAQYNEEDGCQLSYTSSIILVLLLVYNISTI